MKEILIRMGLTDHEISIYQSLLDNGPLVAGIITRKTGIHRRNVYDSLERLIQKGLVGYMKENNTKVFSVTNPQLLVDKLNQQKQELELKLPELLAKYNHKEEKKETLFFRGKEGLKQIFEDQLVVGQEILVNASSVDVEDILKYFFPKFNKIRQDKKIPLRMLFDEEQHTKPIDIPLSQIRYIKEFNKSPMAQYVYGNNVAIIVWAKDPIAILIRQKEVAQGFKNNFEVLWKLAKYKNKKK